VDRQIARGNVKWVVEAQLGDHHNRLVRIIDSFKATE
jgi:hypothetical protein